MKVKALITTTLSEPIGLGKEERPMTVELVEGQSYEITEKQLKRCNPKDAEPVFRKIRNKKE